MLAMVKCDFFATKSYVSQIVVISIIIAFFIWMGTGQLVSGIAAISAMLPFMYIFSIAAYDELNGWERFRLTLPITRRQTALGRYASILLVTIASVIVTLAFGVLAYLIALLFPQFPATEAILVDFSLVTEASRAVLVASTMLVVAAVSMPLFMRFGMTKAARFVPLVMIMIIFGALYVMGASEDAVVQAMPFLETLLVPSANEVWTSLGMSSIVFAVAFVVYALSALLSVKLYEKRQF